MKDDKTSREDKTYSDYDWLDLHQSDRLKKLLNFELGKYLIHHNMKDKLHLPKGKKIEWISAHIGKTRYGALQTEDRMEVTLKTMRGKMTVTWSRKSFRLYLINCLKKGKKEIWGHTVLRIPVLLRMMTPKQYSILHVLVEQ
jgi:hypothetical protein